MTLASRVCWVSAIASLALVAAAAPARAQSAEAEALFRDGRALIKAGKLAPGCDKLAASERLETSVGTLLNLGDCREKLGQLASAWAAFRKAEAVAKHTGGDDRRQAEAARRAKQLEGRFATLTIQVDHRIDGMTVRRDDEVVDDASWATPLPIDPGSYTLTAEAPGFAPWHARIEIAAGASRQTAEIPALTPLPPPPPAEPVATAVQLPPSPRVVRVHRTWSAMRGVSAVLGFAGAGALGTGIYFGIHSRNLEDAANGRCPSSACTDPAGLQLNDDARTAAHRANILYIAGGAALATAAVLWIVGAPDEIAVTPVATAAGGDHRLGVALTGRF